MAVIKRFRFEIEQRIEGFGRSELFFDIRLGNGKQIQSRQLLSDRDEDFKPIIDYMFESCLSAVKAEMARLDEEAKYDTHTTQGIANVFARTMADHERRIRE